MAAAPAAYLAYMAATRRAAPLIRLYLRWRRLRGLEHPTRWPERLGRPSAARPPGPLIWFHAVSLGEGLAALPLVRRCIIELPHCRILMTTTVASAFEVIKHLVPDGVIYQFAPVDVPEAMDGFLRYWNPVAVFLMESELWPNLIALASEKGTAVALLNARMSFKSFNYWSKPAARTLISFMLSKLTLIVPLSTAQAIHFQLLQAPPNIINFAGDLKYGVSADIEGIDTGVRNLCLQMTNRPRWMAASIHRGEEEAILWIHNELVKTHHNLITIIVTRNPQHGKEVASALRRQGLNVALRSRSEVISTSTNIYVVDTLGELRTLYRATPIAVIGGSFLPGLAGHNVSEAAAAGCAILTGPHVGHFSHMISEMQQSNPLSVWQVQGRLELAYAVHQLLGDRQALEARRKAARAAFSAVSKVVVDRVWRLIDNYVLKNVISNFKHT